MQQKNKLDKQESWTIKIILSKVIIVERIVCQVIKCKLLKRYR